MTRDGPLQGLQARADVLKELLRELDGSDGGTRDERIGEIRHLAGEVIHALNNSVGGVLLSTEYALANLDDRDNLERALRNIKIETLHCHSIVRTLLGSMVDRVPLVGE